MEAAEALATLEFILAAEKSFTQAIRKMELKFPIIDIKLQFAQDEYYKKRTIDISKKQPDRVRLLFVCFKDGKM